VAGAAFTLNGRIPGDGVGPFAGFCRDLKERRPRPL